MNIRNIKDTLFKDFSGWFSELAKLAEQSDDSSRLPKLELSLRSGHVIRGSIIRVQANAQAQLLMILGLLDPYTKPEITFVSSNEVVAITLLEPETYVTQLAAPVDHKAVSVLELKHAVRDIEVELEKVLRFNVVLSCDADAVPAYARWDILRTLGFLPSILSSIAADDLVKKQIRENFNRITVHVADSSQTELYQDTLVLRIASSLSIPVAREKERIKKEIENVLGCGDAFSPSFFQGNTESLR